MDQAKALIISGYGTNCERETAYAASMAGADQVQIAHFSELLTEEVCIANFNLLIFPGGFLDGDHLGAAQAAAARIRFSRTKSGYSILQEIKALQARGGLILGICNGFQLLVKLGLLPNIEQDYTPGVSLSHNDSARFEDRWTRLKCSPSCNCVFCAGLQDLYLPVRHGEGKLIPKDKDLLSNLQTKGLIALQYTDAQGRPTQDYPDNPNGSPLAIAGLTDPTGRILGLMPHPEAYNHATNHPCWTRDCSGHPWGISIFSNAVDYLQGKPLSLQRNFHTLNSTPQPSSRS
ncbi:MAG: phosphoribosylformylglycinamidine synthase subunit PurQ [Desulfohalobiaceae bacterium]